MCYKGEYGCGIKKEKRRERECVFGVYKCECESRKETG